MLFKKSENKYKTKFEKNNIKIPYSVMVKLAGEPHSTNSANKRNKKLGYPTHAEWNLKFFDVHFIVEYRVSDSSFTNVIDIEDCLILGDYNFFVDILIPIFSIYKGKDVPSDLKRVLFYNIFDNMEVYK